MRSVMWDSAVGKSAYLNWVDGFGRNGRLHLDVFIHLLNWAGGRFGGLLLSSSGLVFGQSSFGGFSLLSLQKKSDKAIQI